MSTQDQDQFDHDTLRVEDGRVKGSAYRLDFQDGHDVSVGVVSYEYEVGGQERSNHVPVVVISDPDGDILEEPHATDSQYPEQAIQNGKDAARYVLRNPHKFIDT